MVAIAVTDAREEILARLRSSLQDVPDTEQPTDVVVPREYVRKGSDRHDELLARLQERLGDYGAETSCVPADDVTTAVTETCVGLRLHRVIVPPCLPEGWRPERVETVVDEELCVEDLDQADGVLTGCAAAIAETGTLVLDGRGFSGRRVITLIPDHHICIVTVDQIVATVPEGIAAIATSVERHHAPITLVSGPSATSDIELSRVEGVHGPRHLHVLLVLAATDAGTIQRTRVESSSCL